MSASKFRLALIQMMVGANKPLNLHTASVKIAEAAAGGANVVVLPECFNSPYGTQYFKDYAESVPGGPSTEMLANAAKQHGVYVIGGSVPESNGDKLYNTCAVFAPTGELIAKHRKIHLFDIDVKDKIKFTESDVISAGADLSTSIFDTDKCRIGLGICYDIRFGEMAVLHAKKGCQLLVYPGAFNMTTGPAHWKLLCRARAIDNECYVAVCAPATDRNATYISWAHSMVTDPWGTVIGSAGEDERTLMVDIDLDKVREVRAMIPVHNQRRADLYDTVCRHKS